MNLFSAVVTIVAIAAVVTISRHWLESRRRNGVDEERFETVEKELRERIETLERIVTDQREKLRKQIDDL